MLSDTSGEWKLAFLYKNIRIRMRIHLLERRNLLWDILRLPSSRRAALGVLLYYVILTLWRAQGANQRPYALLHIGARRAIHCATGVVLNTLTLTLPSPSAGVSGSLDSYCSWKPLCSGMGEVVPARTLPTLLPPSPRTVLSLSCFKVSQCINCHDWHCKS